MVGVLTDFKDWIFTKYDMLAEFERKDFSLQDIRSMTPKDVREIMKERIKFEYSETFTVLKHDPDSGKF